jgi:beta-lactamase superfamily II metal-dependent hydrolase
MRRKHLIKTDMFTITALPASYGDCLWIEYGDKAAPNVILIDAGLSPSKQLKCRLESLRKRGGFLELVVVTHVDADHIAGMLTLIDKEFYGVPVRDLWFNSFRHLPGESFGEKQGEKLTGLILTKKMPWNIAFDKGSIFVNDDTKYFPEVDLPGGAKIRLLSPDAAQLAKLKKNWIDICGEADLYADLDMQDKYFGERNLADGETCESEESFGIEMPVVDELADEKFSEDDSVANGSSIAFTLCYESKHILCGADAYPSRLLRSLTALYGLPPFKFDVVKVPHHGSDNNISVDFIKAITCSHYLFSSNGARFKHPAKTAVARIVRHGDNANLVFNYRSKYSEVWDNQLIQANFPYTVQYGNDEGATITLS